MQERTIHYSNSLLYKNLSSDLVYWAYLFTFALKSSIMEDSFYKCINFAVCLV